MRLSIQNICHFMGFVNSNITTLLLNKNGPLLPFCIGLHCLYLLRYSFYVIHRREPQVLLVHLPGPYVAVAARRYAYTGVPLFPHRSLLRHRPVPVDLFLHLRHVRVPVDVPRYPDAGVAEYPRDDLQLRPVLQCGCREQVPERVGSERLDSRPFTGVSCRRPFCAPIRPPPAPFPRRPAWARTFPSWAPLCPSVQP